MGGLLEPAPEPDVPPAWGAVVVVAPVVVVVGPVDVAGTVVVVASGATVVGGVVVVAVGAGIMALGMPIRTGVLEPGFGFHPAGGFG